MVAAQLQSHWHTAFFWWMRNIFFIIYSNTWISLWVPYTHLQHSSFFLKSAIGTPANLVEFMKKNTFNIVKGIDFAFLILLADSQHNEMCMKTKLISNIFDLIFFSCFSEKTYSTFELIIVLFTVHVNRREQTYFAFQMNRGGH